MEEEVLNKCRVCLQDSNKVTYIFDEFDQGLSLQQIFEETTGFLVENDSLPGYMCSNCSSILIDFYNLKLLYKENENKLKKMLELSIGKENEDVASDKEIIIQIDEPDETLQESTESCEYVNAETYTCPECGKCYLQEHKIIRHLQSKHNICGVENEEINATIFKIETNSCEKELNCKYCKMSFASWEEMKDHMECHKRNICDICGLGFIKKAYLKDHQDTHFNEKRHVCNYCNKAFKRRTVLVKHKRIHTHPRQCICESCGKAFNDNGTLQTHIKLVHLRERNYVCLICGDKFSLKGTLDKHIKRHENRKREFACSQCPLSYRDKSSLDRHINMKHSGKVEKHTCEVCGKDYSSVGNLYKHLRMCHSGV